MKKIISMIVATVMFLSIIPTTFADDGDAASVEDNKSFTSGEKAESSDAASNDNNDGKADEKKAEEKSDELNKNDEEKVDVSKEHESDEIKTDIKTEDKDVLTDSDKKAENTEKKSDTEDKTVNSDASVDNEKTESVDKGTEKIDKTDKKSDVDIDKDFNQSNYDKADLSVKLTEIKKLIDEKAENAKEKLMPYLNEAKKMFKEAGEKGKELILKGIALIKDKLGDTSIDTFVKGDPIDYEAYDNVKPTIENGRTIVPVRAVSEKLGAEVLWDEDTKTVIVKSGNVEIKMVINSAEAYVNGEKVQLDVPARITDDRTVVPLRFVAENLDLNVNWDEASRTVIVE